MTEFGVAIGCRVSGIGSLECKDGAKLLGGEGFRTILMLWRLPLLHVGLQQGVVREGVVSVVCLGASLTTGGKKNMRYLVTTT